MESEEMRIARLAIEAIIEDLRSREALRVAWDALDVAGQRHVEQIWRRRVEQVVSEERGDG